MACARPYRERSGRRQPLDRLAFLGSGSGRRGIGDGIMTDNGWFGVERVLCVRLDNMGDVLMTTPAFRALKHQAPARRLTLLTSPSAAALAPHLRDIDDVIAYRAPWVKHAESEGDRCEALITQLQHERFDAAVIFTVYSPSEIGRAHV